MRAYERLLRYAVVYTTSDPESKAAPTTARQLDLLNMLADEMKQLGLVDTHVDEFGVCYGWLPATPGMEDQPAVGFIAHVDTAPDFNGENVKPQIIKNYDGGDVLLAGSGDKLTVEEFPTLAGLKGMTLITTDGTSLLGADDKAGIAEIMTAIENVIASGTPHGRICLAFTPDEEVGAGVDHFDVEKFGAAYAYTLDGGMEGEVSYETFNAALAKVHIHGLSVHPGSSKDTMINAALVAMEFNAILPACDTPRNTEMYEGFFHLTDMHGDVNEADLQYIIRDHSREIFEKRKHMMEQAAAIINARYGREVVTLAMRDQYYNMEEVIRTQMHLVENAYKAVEQAGMKPFTEPMRGGTDGCRLSFMGLPTPNLCTGGFAFHGRFEHIAAESMDRCTKMVELLMTTCR